MTDLIPLRASVSKRRVLLGVLLSMAGAALSATVPVTAMYGLPAQEKGRAAATSTEAAGDAKDKTRAASDLMLRAAVLVREGKLAAAEQELIAAERLQPDSCAVLLELASVQHKLGKNKDALAKLEHAIRSGKGFTDSTYVLAAEIFLQEKMYASGEQRLIEWAGDRPISPDFHAAIGLLRLGVLDLGPAEIEFRAALKTDPANELALRGMFKLYGRLNQYARVQRFLDQGVAAKPSSVQLLMLAGSSLMRQDRFADAKERFEKIIAIDPHNASAFVNVGSALHSMGDSDGAIRSFRKAVEIDGRSVEAPVNLARALYMAGRPGEARDVLLAARKRGVEDVQVLNELALAYAANQELDAAAAIARESLAREPKQIEVKKLLGEIERKRKPASAPESSPGSF